MKAQLEAAEFEIIDSNQSVAIFPPETQSAPVTKTVPVEAHAADVDGVPIELLLFTRKGGAYMLEVLRADGNKVQALPAADEFHVMVLAA